LVPLLSPDRGTIKDNFNFPKKYRPAVFFFWKKIMVEASAQPMAKPFFCKKNIKNGICPTNAFFKTILIELSKIYFLCKVHNTW